MVQSFDRYVRRLKITPTILQNSGADKEFEAILENFEVPERGLVNQYLMDKLFQHNIYAEGLIDLVINFTILARAQNGITYLFIVLTILIGSTGISCTL